MMQTLDAGAAFPKMELPRVGGGTVHLGEAADWQMVVVYRGLHCPLCVTYLARLEALRPRFADMGITCVAVSGDPEDKAQAMAEKAGLGAPMAYGLSVAQMHSLGLYVSDPIDRYETDRPFPEPGLFIIDAQGRLHITDISNAPFARPDLEALAAGLDYVRAHDYPIRGRRPA